MKVKAQSKYLRSGARKIRRVANIIRGMGASEALITLEFMPHLGAEMLLKVLKAAIANAKHNYKLPVEKLKVTEICIDNTTPYKRIHPRSRGSAFPILKRQSHITLYLEEAINGSKNPS
jgi:large subunit ribosomal protein L22